MRPTRCIQIPHSLADKRIYLQKSFVGLYYLHYGRGGQAFYEISAAALHGKCGAPGKYRAELEIQ